MKWDKKKSLGLAKFPPSRRHLKLLKLKRRWQNVSGQLKNRIETVEIWRWCWLFSHSSHRRLYNTCLSANRRQKKSFYGQWEQQKHQHVAANNEAAEKYPSLLWIKIVCSIIAWRAFFCVRDAAYLLSNKNNSTSFNAANPRAFDLGLK